MHPPTFESIQQAEIRIRQYLVPTPLRSYKPLDDATGLHVLVKHENHQPTNSFKVRNGLSAVTALSPDQRARGVIAATRGNHGAGVAYAAHLLHVPVVICVPVGNNPEKNEAMRGYGAELIEEGESYDDSVAVMHRIAEQRGLTTIHSTNNRDVIAGAGTMSLEIFQQAREMNEKIDAIVVAVGGGSQAIGAITAARQLNPQIEIYGVQAAAASAIHDSWRAGKPITHATARTFADGVATRSAYEMTFQTLRSGLKDFVVATESEIAAAVRLMIRTTHNLAEGAGAVGLAGLVKLAPRLRGKTVAIVNSGSNIDQLTLKSVMAMEI